MADAERNANIKINIIYDNGQVTAVVSGIDSIDAAQNRLAETEQQALARITAMTNAWDQAIEAAQAMANEQARVAAVGEQLLDVYEAENAAAEKAAQTMAEWDAQLEASKFSQFYQDLGDSTGKLQELDLGLEETISLMNAQNQTLDDAKTKILSLSEAEAQLTEQQQGFSSDLAPTAADFGGGDTGGGTTGGGSLFGAAHGIRAASGLANMVGLGGAGTQAFTGTADVLYLVQGFRSISAILPTVGEAIGSVITFLEPFAPLLLVAAGAVGAYTLAVQENAQELKEGTAMLQSAIDAQDAFYRDSATMTTQQAKDKIATLNDEQTAEQNIMKQRGRQIAEQVGAGVGGLLESQKKEITDTIVKGGVLSSDDLALLTNVDKDVYGPLVDSYEKAQKASQGFGNSIVDYTNGLTQGAFAAGDAKQAEVDHEKQVIDSASRISGLRKQEVTDIQGTSDTIKNRLAGLEAERDGLSDQIDILKKSGDTSNTVTEKIAQYTDQMNTLDDRIVNINSHLPDIISNEQAEANAKQAAAEAAKKEAQAIREANAENAELEGTIKAVITAQDNYNKQIQAAQQNLENTLQINSLKESNAEQKYLPGSLEDVAAQRDIQIKAQRDAAKLAEDTSNQIADVRTKTGQDELKIRTDYNRQIFDDQTKYQDDLAKLQRDAQATAVQDTIDYNNKLADMRKQAYLNEYDDIANRDFSKLAKDQQSEALKEQQASTSYTQQEQKLQTHLQQEETNLASSLARQEQQQKTNEERKIADAETAADSEVEKINTTEKRKQKQLDDSERQQLDDLERHNADKLAQMRLAYIQEITLLQVQENQREQIIAQTEQAAIDAAHAAQQAWHATANDFEANLDRLNQLAAGTSGGSTAPQIYNPMIVPGGAGSYAPPASVGGGIDLNSLVQSIGTAAGQGIQNAITWLGSL